MTAHSGVRAVPAVVSAAIRSAWTEMMGNKLRSILSMSGVMMGVASLVLMASLANGVELFMREVLSRRLAMVSFLPRASSSISESLAWSRSPGLRLSDGVHLERHMRGLASVNRRILRQGWIWSGERRVQASVLGVSESTYRADFRYLNPSEGEGLSPGDFLGRLPVAVISKELAGRLWRPGGRSDGGRGRVVEFEGKTFTIQGVFDAGDPNRSGADFRGSVILPLGAMQRFITGMDPNPGILEIKSDDVAAVGGIASAASKLLVEQHRGATDFLVQTPEGAKRGMETLNNAILLLAALSFITLAMGGLGIMNVMLSSIHERTYEIGVRMSLGASRALLFLQFLVEAVVLSVVGGAVGTLSVVYIMVCKESIRRSLDGIEPSLSPGRFLAILTVVLVLGILSGIYPACKASRMHPVEALRKS